MLFIEIDISRQSAHLPKPIHSLTLHSVLWIKLYPSLTFHYEGLRCSCYPRCPEHLCSGLASLGKNSPSLDYYYLASFLC